VGGSEGAGAERDERDAVDILNEEMSDYVSSKTTRGISLTVEDYTDPLELVDYYEKMVAARDRMLDEMTQE
jgi:hypothetical protein